MNVVIGQSETQSMLNSLFYDNSKSLETWQKEDPIHYSQAEDLQALMLEVGAYKTKSEAMRAGRSGPIPKGYSEYKASKKIRLWLWNPCKQIGVW